MYIDTQCYCADVFHSQLSGTRHSFYMTLILYSLFTVFINL